MTLVVCDASVLLKLLVEEEDTHLARSLASSCHISVPEIAVAEIGNALWVRLHDGRLKPDDTESLIEKFLDAPLDVRPLRPLTAAALRIAHRLDHPIYDCYYLALAESLAVPLVSADRRFIAAVRKTAMTTADVKLLAEFA